MTDGESEIIRQIDDLLEGGEITTKAALRVMLQAVRGLYSCLSDTSDKVRRMWPVYRAISWLGPAVGILILGLLWALLTGQASIQYP